MTACNVHAEMTLTFDEFFHVWCSHCTELKTGVVFPFFGVVSLIKCVWHAHVINHRCSFFTLA